MLSRRSLLTSASLLAAGCGPLDSYLRPPGRPQIAEFNVAAYTRFITLLTPHNPGSPRQRYEEATAALAADKQNPNGPARGGYHLRLRLVEDFIPETDQSTTPRDAIRNVTAVLNGLDAHLVTVWPELAQWLGRQGLLLPLNRFSGADEETLNRQFFPVTLDRFRADGALYALPVSSAPLMLYYDAKLLQAQGLPAVDSSWEWKALEEAASQLTILKNDGTVQRWGLDSHSEGLWWALWQNGADLLDPDTLNCRLQEPAASEALQFAHDLIHRHRVSPPDSLPEWRELVGSTPPAMAYLHPPPFPLWGTLRMAALPRAKAHTVPVRDGFGIGIATRTQQTEAAFTALQGLVSAMQDQVVIPAGREAVARLSETRSNLPPEEAAAVEFSLEHGRARPKTATQGIVMNNIVESLVRGDNVESVVNNACAVVQEFRQTGETGQALPLKPDRIWNYHSGPP